MLSVIKEVIKHVNFPPSLTFLIFINLKRQVPKFSSGLLSLDTIPVLKFFQSAQYIYMDFFHLNYIQFHNTFKQDRKCYQAKVFFFHSVGSFEVNTYYMKKGTKHEYYMAI